MPQPESGTHWRGRRPDDVTEAQIAEWFARFEVECPDDIREIGLYEMCRKDRAFFEKVWCTGEWVNQRLLALGCPEEVRYDITFALGQKMVVARDPWAVAQAVVSDYEQGRINTSTPVAITLGRTLSYRPLEEETLRELRREGRE